MPPTMEAAQRDRAAKRRRAQAYQRQHQGTAGGMVRPNLEKLARESSRKIKPPNIH
jgi:hypothetical protein